MGSTNTWLVAHLQWNWKGLLLWVIHSVIKTHRPQQVNWPICHGFYKAHFKKAPQLLGPSMPQSELPEPSGHLDLTAGAPDQLLQRSDAKRPRRLGVPGAMKVATATAGDSHCWILVGHQSFQCLGSIILTWWQVSAKKCGAAKVQEGQSTIRVPFII